MTARYICIEGTEGVGKTTQTQKLVDYLRYYGHSVLQTKEPGTSHAPLTLELRNIMLNAKYESELTPTARELVSQAIRSIHLQKVIYPRLDSYDFIVQDRGILSGLAYGVACGNREDWIEQLLQDVVDPLKETSLYDLYSNVVVLTGDVRKGLDTARSAKQEFEAGDAIEMRGYSFMETVNTNMLNMAERFSATIVSVNNKSIDEVFTEMLMRLSLGE